jgi:transketolase
MTDGGGNDLAQRSINTLRTLAMDAVEAAQNGHPGMPMGAAPMAYVLWREFLRHNPKNPSWPNRDRFVLSAGHGSMLLYALLHLSGYDLSLDDLKAFRQWGSRTPGHPEYGHTPGVEATTGPLGQGFANGVGMAMAEAYLAERLNRPGHALVDHHTYAIVSDGDLMEGISSEAASLAGHLALGKIVYLYDDNHISIEGDTEVAFTEDRMARFAAYGWHVQTVHDGNDLAAIRAAIAAARAETRRPSIIQVRTHLAYGAPHLMDNAKAHGSPLGADEVRAAKRFLGWPEDAQFLVPEDVARHMGEAVGRGEALQEEWRAILEGYRRAFPDQAAAYEQALAGAVPEDALAAIPDFAPDPKGMATRAASGRVLNALAPRMWNLLGGSADLAPSNDTHLQGEADFGPAVRGRNLHFGVREHAMGGILTGMALHGGLKVYGGTFLVFSDYMRGAIRVAAISRAPVVYVFTHDSIGLGQDGPTHQPVEQLASLRAMPGLTVLRPADANETAGAWRVALAADGPVALALTRQAVPVLAVDPANVARGGYVVRDAAGAVPDVILIGTGSEVSLCLEAQALLASQGIGARVVSLPSWELFSAQDQAYRDRVLPPDVRARVAVEAASPFGWERYLGACGVMVGVDRFGASAPGDQVMRQYGMTAEHVVAAAREAMAAARQSAMR